MAHEQIREAARQIQDINEAVSRKVWGDASSAALLYRVSSEITSIGYVALEGAEERMATLDVVAIGPDTSQDPDAQLDGFGGVHRSAIARISGPIGSAWVLIESVSYTHPSEGRVTLVSIDSELDDSYAEWVDSNRPVLSAATYLARSRTSSEIGTWRDFASSGLESLISSLPAGVGASVGGSIGALTGEGDLMRPAWRRALEV
jgi:hypothetical protein